MRIALVNRSSRTVGGAGTYIRSVCAALTSRGHEIRLWCESEDEAEDASSVLPSATPRWSVSLGLKAALTALAEWRPAVLFSHGLLDPAVERSVLKIAPSVFVAHPYYGTCISGAKTFKTPTITPCFRTFGWPCLVNYYPRRCGGWSPITMMREFRRQAERLELLSQYDTIVTLSRHMQREYTSHGLNAVWVQGATGQCGIDEPAMRDDPEREGERKEWKLLFAGRMEQQGRGILHRGPASRCQRTGSPTQRDFRRRRPGAIVVGDGGARNGVEAAGASFPIHGVARYGSRRCVAGRRRPARHA